MSHTAPSDETTRLLLVANRTCPCPALPDQVLEHVGEREGEVHIVAPALNSRLRHWVSDVDAAIAAATERMDGTITTLREHGLTVTGEVGDADPLVAIADALPAFSATSIMISTWPSGASNWLERQLPERAAATFELPIHHVVSPYDAPTPAVL